MTLSEFLQKAIHSPFTFGTWDCGRFVAAWIKDQTGREPGLKYIGKYTTALQLARIVKREGGLIPLFDRSFTEIGLIRSSCLQRGYVVIVGANEGPTGAIMINEGMCARLSVSGILFESVPVLATWKV